MKLGQNEDQDAQERKCHADEQDPRKESLPVHVAPPNLRDRCA